MIPAADETFCQAFTQRHFSVNTFLSVKWITVHNVLLQLLHCFQAEPLWIESPPQNANFPSWTSQYIFFTDLYHPPQILRNISRRNTAPILPFPTATISSSTDEAR